MDENVLLDAKSNTAVDCSAPQEACPTASFAEAVKSVNCGIATAARMPRMTITTTSSIKVNPFCNRSFISARSLSLSPARDAGLDRRHIVPGEIVVAESAICQEKQGCPRQTAWKLSESCMLHCQR